MPTNSSNEQQYYENPDLWGQAPLGDAERVRVQEFAKRVPAVARSVLDVGCGDGKFLHHLALHRADTLPRLCGVDRSKAALSHVRVESFQASADALPYADREFDLVSALEVIEHLPVRTYEAALSEMCRVAGAYVLLGVPFNEDLRAALVECPSCLCGFNPTYHLRAFDESSLRSLLQSRGFQCEQIFYVCPTRRLHRWLAPAWRRMRHVALRSSLPPFSLCPACGHEAPARSAGPGARVGATFADRVSKLANLVRTARSYRWIGALYRRG